MPGPRGGPAAPSSCPCEVPGRGGSDSVGPGPAHLEPQHSAWRGGQGLPRGNQGTGPSAQEADSRQGPDWRTVARVPRDSAPLTPQASSGGSCAVSGLVYKASWPSFPPRCIFTFRQPVLGDTHCTRRHTSRRTTHATPDSSGRGLQGEMGATAGSLLLAGGVVLPARWGLFSHSVPGSTSQGASRTQGPGPAQSPWQAGSRARSPLPGWAPGVSQGLLPFEVP